ncbi:hypothetical protein [Bradyrhizobium sp. BRP56]|uniref:hypothetical protein n=1 Tax=Bradyrhizobium sp. BRP56 TaxID=2793819 RepID=UPI001CD478A9|nr:hypothetical protein [Bradyrhizobium sp. BRP56]MCA1401111.1 hypothetical protein [Bradyrhizobium sp. BRP56]
MPDRIDIDHKHSRAILKVIGQQLRASLKLEPEQPERSQSANRTASGIGGTPTKSFPLTRVVKRPLKPAFFRLFRQNEQSISARKVTLKKGDRRLWGERRCSG